MVRQTAVRPAVAQYLLALMPLRLLIALMPSIREVLLAHFYTIELVHNCGKCCWGRLAHFYDIESAFPHYLDHIKKSVVK